FFMTSFSPLEAILSSFNWSENSKAGHAHRRAQWGTRPTTAIGPKRSFRVLKSGHSKAHRSLI
ncbi:hypothetical protein, partial [Burkholderia multivorans]|uniref:hypothetical protein n=1 Tax=Burkholderia multivorans TaxID=87883 RepID=UPI001C612B15